MKNILKYGSFLQRKKSEPAGARACEPVRTDAKAEQAATIHRQQQTDVQPVRTGSTLVPVATPSWHSPEEQAAALLKQGFNVGAGDGLERTVHR